MLRVLIVADDLSGAADCGVAFTRADISTIVALGDATTDGCAQVLSIDADTRGLTAQLAAERVRSLVHRHAHDRDLLVFKKIDSTLRGHVGAELAAMLAAYRSLHPDPNRPIAVLAPAFPSIGRTTVNGFQFVHGNPLHEMEVWQLQGMSHRPYLPDMLDRAGLKSALLGLNVVRSDQRNLVHAMSSSASQADVLVCDAETDADLQAIARASMGLERKTIWVGSAGLAYHLCEAAEPGTATVAAESRLPPLSGPLLFVVGSLSRNSNEQIEVLTSSSATLRLSVPPDILLAGAESERWREYERELGRAIAMKHDVLLGPGSEFQVGTSDRPRLSSSLARMTASVSDRVGALIAAGGETARMVLRCWGVTSLRLVGELEKGVPLSTAENWSRQLTVITKAGDFGKPETLLHCAQFLHSAERNLHWPGHVRKVLL